MSAEQYVAFDDSLGLTGTEKIDGLGDVFVIRQEAELGLAVDEAKAYGSSAKVWDRVAGAVVWPTRKT